jgi:hypothetical protein
MAIAFGINRSNSLDPTHIGFVGHANTIRILNRRVISIGRWRARRHFFGVVAELAEHQVVSSRGARSALLPDGDAFLWVLTQKLYRIANQLLKVVVAKSGSYHLTS